MGILTAYFFEPKSFYDVGLVLERAKKMVDVWFQPLVWIDYRLALLFTLIVPFFLLIWAILSQVEAIQRLMILYWRVASLLMISLYLMIPGWSIAFVTGFVARILIPISLWFWVDINDEIKDLPGSGLKMALTSWRWAITLYCTLRGDRHSAFSLLYIFFCCNE